MERAERLYVLQAPRTGLTASSRTRRVAFGRRGLHQLVRFARTLHGSVGLEPLLQRPAHFAKHRLGTVPDYD